MKDIKLRPTAVSDLEILFQIQLDEEANYQAAFTSKDSQNKEPTWQNIQDYSVILLLTIKPLL
jgi:hypothetical protein